MRAFTTRMLEHWRAGSRHPLIFQDYEQTASLTSRSGRNTARGIQRVWKHQQRITGRIWKDATLPAVNDLNCTSIPHKTSKIPYLQPLTSALENSLTTSQIIQSNCTLQIRAIDMLSYPRGNQTKCFIILWRPYILIRFINLQKQRCHRFSCCTVTGLRSPSSALEHQRRAGCCRHTALPFHQLTVKSKHQLQPWQGQRCLIFRKLHVKMIIFKIMKKYGRTQQ